MRDKTGEIISQKDIDKLKEGLFIMGGFLLCIIVFTILAMAYNKNIEDRINAENEIALSNPPIYTVRVTDIDYEWGLNTGNYAIIRMDSGGAFAIKYHNELDPLPLIQINKTYSFWLFGENENRDKVTPENILLYRLVKLEVVP